MRAHHKIQVATCHQTSRAQVQRWIFTASSNTLAKADFDEAALLSDCVRFFSAASTCAWSTLAFTCRGATTSKSLGRCFHDSQALGAREPLLSPCYSSLSGEGYPFKKKVDT